MSAAATVAEGYSEYRAGLEDSHAYLLPAVLAALGPPSRDVRIFELGCGNGSVAEEFDRRGWSVVGVDPSPEGIAQARRLRPHLDIRAGSADDDLAARYGQFDVVLSLEVVEHVYAPRRWARSLFDLVRPGGQAIVSTPYHG